MEDTAKKLLLSFFCSFSPLLHAQTLTLEDIFFSSKYREKHPENLFFMENDAFYSVQEGAAILKKETATGKTVDTVLSQTDTLLGNRFALFQYDFSAGEKQLLLAGNYHGIYRRSYTADYVLATPSTSHSAKWAFHVLPAISYATFSPDGSKIAYVKENNLYWFDIASKTHVQVTTNGKKNSFINGSTDWVYEEEFEFTKAFFWNPDSRHIAFYTFDEREVPEYNMQKWEDLYPTDYRFKYPKAGEKNSKVGIQVYDVQLQKTRSLALDTLSAYYVPRIQWTNRPGVLALSFLNRDQTQLQLAHYNTENQHLSFIYKELNSPIEIQDPLFYLPDGTCVRTSEKEGTKKAFQFLSPQATSFSYAEKTLPLEGKELENLVYLDEKRQWLYFTFSEGAVNKKVGRLSLTSKKVEILTADPGVHHIQVSSKGNFYMISHSEIGSPSTHILYDAKSKRPIRALEENKELKQKLGALALSTARFFQFTTSENMVLNGWMLTPRDFDSTKRYPLIQFVYGGPGSQMVTNAWTGSQCLWHHYLTTQGFIVACVDGRGTGGRGNAFRTCTYKRLGELETKDQLEAAKYLGSLRYVDNTRIGIWGWSFGGYLSTQSLLLGDSVFKAAVAVAPVTNWRFYDTIYTERYLSTPQDNAKGYDLNSPLTYADRLKGAYLLIHGTSDDNVHIQHTYALQEALVKAGKQFDSFIYPNKAHGLSGGKTRLHLYTMMSQFWKDKLNP